MPAATQQTIAFVALNDVIQPDYRAVVSRRALTFRRQAPLVGRKHFDAAMTPFLHVQALDDSTVVSANAVHTLVEACQRDDAAMHATLELWVQSQQPLARRMREFLVSQNLEAHEFTALSGGFLGTRPQEQMLALVNDFHTRNPAFNTYDTALMLCCVHGYLPGTNAARPTASEPAAPLAQVSLDELPHTRWHAWLDELRALPLDAPEWDARSAQMFNIATQQLVEQRLAERQAIRDRLHQSLRLLREQTTDQLIYFGLEAAHRWDTDALPIGQIIELADSVTEFYGQLSLHRSGLQQAPAPTRAMQAERRRELDALEEWILARYAELQTRFVAAPSPEADLPDIAAEAPTAPEFTAAGPADLQSVDAAVQPAEADSQEAINEEPISELMLAVGAAETQSDRVPASTKESTNDGSLQQRGGFFRRRL